MTGLGLLVAPKGGRVVTSGRVAAHCSYSAEQFGQADEIVSGGCKGEGSVDLAEAAELRSSQSGDGLDPAERLFDPFTGALTVDIAGVAGGAMIDGRAPAADVLGDVWSDVQGAKLLDEIGGIVAAVGAQDPFTGC